MKDSPGRFLAEDGEVVRREAVEFEDLVIGGRLVLGVRQRWAAGGLRKEGGVLAEACSAKETEHAGNGGE